MRQFKVKGKEYPLTKEMKIHLQKNKLSMALLCRRIELGWSLYESVNVPVGMKIKEFSNFINYKLDVHPGNNKYIEYRSKLDKLDFFN